ncbi:folliculin-like [Paramacrobiotus metropolitanus]|uniref:folliculin-like n=1 Tax=Paramacrobiotus metropolitanus TaxID=2943436 RepID=UPI0024462936|nr:folliculin-like [Paramacrobiotus metropolitanus]
MNAVLALCHFCEMHGPSVMMCTQPFPRDGATEVDSRTTDESTEERPGQTKRLSVSESESELTESDTFEAHDSFGTNTCAACRSFAKPNQGCMTADKDGDVWYLTLQYPYNPEVFTFLRQACVRSLSSEISPGREGPIMFGDNHHGYVYCYTFYLKDNEARGLQRWYSIVVLSMDKLSLTQSWPFLTRSSRSIVAQMQALAEKTFSVDQAERPQRTARLGGAGALNPENFRRQRRGKVMRSLPELTSEPNIFHCLHEHFTHMLQLGGNQMSETLLEGSPSCSYSHREDDFDNGLAGINNHSRQGSLMENGLDSAMSSPTWESEIDTSFPRFEGIVHIYRVMGKVSFLKLAYHITIGNQIVVRGFHDFLISSVIRAIEVLIPFGCRRSIPFSSTYVLSWNCNLLGLHPDAAMPDDILSSPDYFVVDVLAAKMNEMNVDKYKIITPNAAVPKVKLPTYLSRVERILEEPDIAEQVAVALIANEQERMLSKAKVLYKLFRTESRSADELPIIMQKLHIADEDNGVMRFWMTALSDEYKGYLKELSFPHPAVITTKSKHPPPVAKSIQAAMTEDRGLLLRRSGSSKDTAAFSDVTVRMYPGRSGVK